MVQKTILLVLGKYICNLYFFCKSNFASKITYNINNIKKLYHIFIFGFVITLRKQMLLDAQAKMMEENAFLLSREIRLITLFSLF